MQSQNALTVVCEIDPDRLGDLRLVLAAIGENPGDNAILPMARMPRSHFARFVIVDNDPELPRQLVFESNHDGDPASYLAELAGNAAIAPGLEQIFGCCKEWPRDGAASPMAFCEYLQARSLRAEAFHCGYRGVTAAQVHNDLRIYEKIGGYLDRNREALKDLAPGEIKVRILGFLEEARRAEPDLDLAPQPDAVRTRKLRFWALAAALAPLAVPLAPLAAGAYAFLRYYRNRTDEVAGYDRPVNAPTELARIEDRVIQNQLTHVVELKPGWFRFGLLRVALAAVDLLARYRFTEGALGGITSIHFARWVLLLDPRPGARPPRHRLLFLSSYDGSWESYLGAFIDRAAVGLTSVWSNTQDFPRTRGLWGEGARDEEAFKQWTRNHQLPSQVWYSSVPNATVKNVRNAIWIRARLEQELDARECSEWLARL